MWVNLITLPLLPIIHPIKQVIIYYAYNANLGIQLDNLTIPARTIMTSIMVNIAQVNLLAQQGGGSKTFKIVINIGGSK